MQTPMTMQSSYPDAPELAIARWFNTANNPTLSDLRGEVVVIEAFQMLCPGCVSHGLPQAKRIQQAFHDDVTLLGLHCVFEHHEAMTPVSLEAFLHEYRITFPVGVDAHVPGVTLPRHDGSIPVAGHAEPSCHRSGRTNPPQRIRTDRRPVRRRNPRPSH